MTSLFPLCTWLVLTILVCTVPKVGAQEVRGLVELDQTFGTLEQLDDTLRQNPTDANAYYNRGVTHSTLKQHERALADYTEALRLNPRYAEAYNNRGLAHSELHQYEQALADYTEALRLNPQYAKAYYNRGNTYFDLKQYEQALADYTEALHLNPQYARAYWDRGLVYLHLRQEQQAQQDFARCVAIDPSLKSALDESVQQARAQRSSQTPPSPDKTSSLVPATGEEDGHFPGGGFSLSLRKGMSLSEARRKSGHLLNDSSVLVPPSDAIHPFSDASGRPRP